MLRNFETQLILPFQSQKRGICQNPNPTTHAQRRNPQPASPHTASNLASNMSSLLHKWRAWKQEYVDMIKLGLAKLFAEKHEDGNVDVIAEVNPVAWVDSERDGEVGAGICTDEYAINASLLGEGVTRKQMHEAQPLGVSIGCTRFNAKLRMMRCKHVMVMVKMTGDVEDPKDRLFPMCSDEYYEYLAISWDQGGGTIDNMTADEMREAALDDSNDALLDTTEHEHRFTSLFRKLHTDAGIHGESEFPMYHRMVVVPDGEQLAIATHVFGADQECIKLSHTSSFDYCMDKMTSNVTPVREALGVWNMKADGSGMEMCAIKIDKTTTAFDIEGVASMINVENKIAKNIEIEIGMPDANPDMDTLKVKSEPKSDPKPSPESVRDQTDVVSADTSPYPLAGPDGRLQNKVHGTFISTLSLPMRLIPRKTTQNRGQTTRGGSAPTYVENKDEEEDENLDCKLTYACMGAGEPIRDAYKLGNICTKRMRLCTPALTIVDVIVAGDIELKPKNVEVRAAVGANLVHTLVEHWSNFQKMCDEIAVEAPCGIHQSSTSLQGNNVTSAQKAALASSKECMTKSSGFFVPGKKMKK